MKINQKDYDQKAKNSKNSKLSNNPKNNKTKNKLYIPQAFTLITKNNHLNILKLLEQSKIKKDSLKTSRNKEYKNNIYSLTNINDLLINGYKIKNRPNSSSKYNSKINSINTQNKNNGVLNIKKEMIIPYQTFKKNYNHKLKSKCHLKNNSSKIQYSVTEFTKNNSITSPLIKQNSKDLKILNFKGNSINQKKDKKLKDKKNNNQSVDMKKIHNKSIKKNIRIDEDDLKEKNFEKIQKLNTNNNDIFSDLENIKMRFNNIINTFSFQASKLKSEVDNYNILLNNNKDII